VADVGKVTRIRQKEDDEVIRVNGRPLLDPIQQRSEKCSTKMQLLGRPFTRTLVLAVLSMAEI
jgi:hypothetical protein